MTLMGTVALVDQGARPTVDLSRVRSHGYGEFIKRGRDTKTFVAGVDAEFVGLGAGSA